MRVFLVGVVLALVACRSLSAKEADQEVLSAPIDAPLIDAPLIVSVTALLVSVVVAFVSFWRWRKDRSDYYLEKQPRLRIYSNDSSDFCGLHLINAGLGPAEIKEFTVNGPSISCKSSELHGAVPASQVWFEALQEIQELQDLKDVLQLRGWRPGDLIKEGESLDLISINLKADGYKQGGTRDLKNDREKLMSAVRALTNLVEIKFIAIVAQTPETMTARWPPNG